MKEKEGQLYLKPNERKFLALAVVDCLETVRAQINNPSANWNPEALAGFKEINIAGTSLLLKMKRLGFDMRPLPKFKEGDEKDWING